MSSLARVLAARNAAAMVSSLELLAAEVQVDGARVKQFMTANPVPYLRASRVSVPASLDRLQLLGFFPGHFDHEDIATLATSAGVPVERAPPLGAVALGHEVRGFYAGLELGRDQPARLSLVVDAGWGPWGLVDALRLLGVDEPARERVRALLGALPGAGGHFVGAWLDERGDSRLLATRIVRYEAPGDTAIVGNAMKRLSAGLGLPKEHGADLASRLPGLRPGPSAHDLLVTVELDETGVLPGFAVELVALPTLVALDSLDGFGFDASLGGALSTVESLLAVPHDDAGRRWLDGLRLGFGPDPRPTAEFAWFVEPERYQSLSAAMN